MEHRAERIRPEALRQRTGGLVRWIGAGAIFTLAVGAGLTPAPERELGERPRAADWPEFHGRARDNKSPETGLLERWPEGGPRLLWTSEECGRGYATISIAEGRLYTSGDFEREEMVLALDLDGRLLWKTPNGSAWRGATPGSRCTPTYRDGVVYHMNPTGRIGAFQAKSGECLWAVDLEERFGVQRGAWALSENVVVEDGAVLCAPGGAKGRIVALDRKTGGTLWANTEISERAAYCSPLVVTHDGVKQLVTLMQRSVVSLDVRTGKLLWKHDHETPYDLNATVPVARGGRVFVTSGYGAGGHLIEIGPRSQSARVVWSGGELDNCHTGVMLIGDYLYGSGCRQSEKGFVCVDFRTGKTMWTNAPIGKVTPLLAEGRLYSLEHTGTMMILSADEKGCRVISQFNLPSNDRYDCLAHPVIWDGKLYIRQAHRLYAYDIRRSPPPRAPDS